MAMNVYYDKIQYHNKVLVKYKNIKGMSRVKTSKIRPKLPEFSLKSWILVPRHFVVPDTFQLFKNGSRYFKQIWTKFLGGSF